MTPWVRCGVVIAATMVWAARAMDPATPESPKPPKTVMDLRMEMAAQAASPWLPEDQIANTALILMENGKAGSGFFLYVGPGLYLVTAKHVLCDLKSGQPLTSKAQALSYSKRSDPGRNVFNLDLAMLKASGLLRVHPTHDVAVLRIGRVKSLPHPSTIEWLPGISRSARAPGGIIGTPAEYLKLLREVSVSNEAYVIGFPISLGGPFSEQLDRYAPLVKRGSVAGVSDHDGLVILDAAAYPGNSGGVVVEVTQLGPTRQFRSIGLVVRLVKYLDQDKATGLAPGNSGYAIVEPMDYVLELVDKSDLEYVPPSAAPKPEGEAK